jgi:hypothetical protein
MDSIFEGLEETANKLERSAGAMMSAANRLHTAVGIHDSSLTAFMTFMDNWMTRLEAVMGRHRDT